MARIIGRRRPTQKKIKEQKVQEEPLHIESITWGDLTWINIQPPTQREIDYLAENYPFHPLDLDDCLSRKQIPKVMTTRTTSSLFFTCRYMIRPRA